MAVFYKAPILAEETIDPNTEYMRGGEALIDVVRESYAFHLAATYWPLLLIPALWLGLKLTRYIAARRLAGRNALDRQELDTAVS